MTTATTAMGATSVQYLMNAFSLQMVDLPCEVAFEEVDAFSIQEVIDNNVEKIDEYVR